MVNGTLTPAVAPAFLLLAQASILRARLAPRQMRALGRIEESRRRKGAIEFAPTRADLYRGPEAAKQLTADDPHRVAREALAASPTSLWEEEDRAYRRRPPRRARLATLLERQTLKHRWIF